MSATTSPENRNFLSPFGFKFILARAPNLNYNVQSVSLPDLNLGIIEVPTPFVVIPWEGKIRYGLLSVTFKVDEDMHCYTELHDWMVKLGTTTEYPQYKSLSDETRNNPGSPKGLHSDISLQILDSAYNPKISITYTHCVPTALTGLNMTSTDTAMNYIDCTATFQFMKYEIKTT